MKLTDGDRFLVAMTVVLEAEGEPELGQQAVAWVVRNRMMMWRQDASTVVLARLQFSAWNHDQPRRRALSKLFAMPAWREALAATDAVFSDQTADPSGGATHYLREDATRAGRKNHDLPPWFKEANVTARIGHHTFLTA